MAREIGVGVIGTGFMGRCHALAWHNVAAVFDDVPRPRIAVIGDSDAGAARAMADAFGVARAVDDWEQVIAAPEVEIVSITLPNALHRPAAIAALRAGKHVWCEKPMSAALADAEAMTQAAGAAAGCVTALGYNYQCNPAVIHAARLIAEGAIGRAVHVRGRFDEDYAADASLPWSWRYRRAEAGLGVLADLMCHLVGMVQMLAGPITDVTGQTGIVHPSRPMEGGGGHGTVDNEDNAAALVRFAGGATGVLAASRTAWGRKNHLAWEVHGTAGTLAFDQERMNELLLHEADGPAARRGFRVIPSGPLHPPYARFCPAPGHQLGFNELKIIEAHRLLRAVAGEKSGTVSFAEGLAVERVVHAIAASAESGRREEIREPGG